MSIKFFTLHSKPSHMFEENWVREGLVIAGYNLILYWKLYNLLPLCLMLQILCYIYKKIIKNEHENKIKFRCISYVFFLWP